MKLKRIKIKNNENLNIYTIIGDNSGKSSEENEDNNFYFPKKRKSKRKSDFKRNSLLLSINQDDFKENKKFKFNNRILSMGEYNEDTLNTIKKIRELKNSIKRNSKNNNYKRIISNRNSNQLNDNLLPLKKKNS